MRMSVKEVAAVAEGSLSGPESSRPVTGVTISSRSVTPGDMFVAFQGSTLDGHDFVDEAFRQGASAALVSKPVDAEGPLIRVPDTASALTKLAVWVRDSIDPIVIGITGSTGKTSTKDLVVSVVSGRFATIGSPKNYNNEIGVPLTLLSLKTESEVAVCEMGARGIGHIAALCDVARPQVGIVTNIGVTHYEQFGSVEAIASAKSELIRSLPEAGTAILNADDASVIAMRQSAACDVITFGLKEKADVMGEFSTLDGLGRPSLRISCNDESIWVTLPFSGKHHCANALAAVAAGSALGIPLTEMRRGLETAVPSPWRMQAESFDGMVLVNDSYNASPTSVVSAIETCGAMVSEEGRLIAVLGYMAELGDIEYREHRKVGEIAGRICSIVVVVGAKAEPIAEGARQAGGAEVIQVASPEDVVSVLRDMRPGDVVLVKGSRSARLEAVTESLKGVKRT